MNLIRFAVASTLTSAATLMYAHPLMAADAKIDNDTTLDEVVVTAQNRVENVQNVPIAIDVVSSEKIADSGFTNLNDIQKIAPAVQLINDNSQLRVTIRGVGSNTNDETDDTSVVLNVDGEYINRGVVLGASMFDVDRIEVLRGPQGTLEGRNSTGGAINVITRKPGDKFAADATVDFGNYGSKKINGGLDIPLGTIGGLRFSGLYTDHDSYFSHPANINFVNPSGPPLTPAATSGSEKDTAGRVSLRLDPSDALKINLAYERGNRNYVNTAADTVDLTAPANAPGVGCSGPGYVNAAPLYAALATNPFYACVPQNTNFLAGKNRSASFIQPWFGVGGYKLDTSVVRAKVEYKLGEAATITYTGGYRTSSNPGAQGLPVNYWSDTFQSDIKTHSHELRINGESGPVLYQAGVFYFQERLDEAVGFGLETPSFPTFSTGWLSYFTRNQVSDSKSAFGQLDYKLSDTLTAQAGVRYTEDTRSALYGAAPFPDFGPPVQAAPVSLTTPVDLAALYGKFGYAPKSEGSTDVKTTWLADLNYKPQKYTLIYGKISTGFKAGGFDQVGAFKPESNTAFEVGIKQNFGASGQHYLNVDAFKYNYTNLQVSALLNPAVGGQTFNAGKATIWGVEAEGGFKITSDDVLSVTANYLNAKFDQFLGVDDIACVAPTGSNGCANFNDSVSNLNPNSAGPLVQPNFAGNTPANSPKIVATLGYEHTFHLGGAGSLKAGLFERYKSSYFTDFYNYNDSKQKAYNQTDLNIEYKLPANNLSVQAYVTNIENYRPLINAYFIAAGPDNIYNFWYGEPRLYGVRLGYKY